MGKILTNIIFLTILLAALTAARIQEGNSIPAEFSIPSINQCTLTESHVDLIKKRYALYSFFKKNNSPLIEYTDDFIQTCTKYNLDCYLLPSIASLESAYGKRYIKSTNNPFGWGNGHIRFTSMSQAIDTIGKFLKENYIDKGRVEIEQIGKIYASDPNWAKKVYGIHKRIKKEEEKLDLILGSHFIQLVYYD